MSKVEFADWVAEPDGALKIEDLSELVIFEEIVAESMTPDMTEGQRNGWAFRAPLRDRFRTPQFHGPITDITIELINDAYEELIKAKKDKEVKFHPGDSKFTPRKTPESIDRATRLTRGFVMAAHGLSFSLEPSKDITNQFWYVPGLETRGPEARAGSPILRYVTIPSITDIAQTPQTASEAPQHNFPSTRNFFMGQGSFWQTTYLPLAPTKKPRDKQ